MNKYNYAYYHGYKFGRSPEALLVISSKDFCGFFLNCFHRLEKMAINVMLRAMG